MPVKEKKIKQKVRWFYYFITEHNGKIYIRKSGSKRYLGKPYTNLFYWKPKNNEVIEIEQLINLPAFRNSV